MLMCTKWCLQMHAFTLFWITVLLLLLKCTFSYYCSTAVTVIKLNWFLIIKNKKNCRVTDMQYYIGLVMFIGLKMLSNNGYWIISKMSYRHNTSVCMCVCTYVCMYVCIRAQTIIGIFRLIFVCVIFEYQFSDQLFVCYNFVHFWWIKMLQTSFYYPFCCVFSVVIHVQWSKAVKLIQTHLMSVTFICLFNTAGS